MVIECWPTGCSRALRPTGCTGPLGEACVPSDKRSRSTVYKVRHAMLSDETCVLSGAMGSACIFSALRARTVDRDSRRLASLPGLGQD